MFNPWNRGPMIPTPIRNWFPDYKGSVGNSPEQNYGGKSDGPNSQDFASSYGKGKGAPEFSSSYGKGTDAQNYSYASYGNTSPHYGKGYTQPYYEKKWWYKESQVIRCTNAANEKTDLVHLLIKSPYGMKFIEEGVEIYNLQGTVTEKVLKRKAEAIIVPSLFADRILDVANLLDFTQSQENWDEQIIKLSKMRMTRTKTQVRDMEHFCDELWATCSGNSNANNMHMIDELVKTRVQELLKHNLETPKKAPQNVDAEELAMVKAELEALKKSSRKRSGLDIDQLIEVDDEEDDDMDEEHVQTQIPTLVTKKKLTATRASKRINKK